jgi:hypothetical protein
MPQRLINMVDLIIIENKKLKIIIKEGIILMKKSTAKDILKITHWLQITEDKAVFWTIIRLNSLITNQKIQANMIILKNKY